MKPRRFPLTHAEVWTAVRWPGGPHLEPFRTADALRAPAGGPRRGFWNESPAEAMTNNQTIVPAGGERRES